jgi:RHS repeat-associated protein
MVAFAENSSYTRSPVSPKTHTPWGRLQVSGYRYYSTELGRFVNRDPVGEDGGLLLYGFVGNNSICVFDALGLDYLDCLAACIDQNDPMNAIIDSFIGQLTAKLALGSAGVPKSILLWLAKRKGDAVLVKKIERSIRLGKDLGYKPTKIILSWLKVNRGAAASAARSQAYVLAIYGGVLVVVELDCAFHCICRDRYEGDNLFNTKEAIDFYIKKLFEEKEEKWPSMYDDWPSDLPYPG